MLKRFKKKGKGGKGGKGGMMGGGGTKIHAGTTQTRPC